MRCPYCQAPRDPADTFCGECGRQLPSQAPRPPARQPPPAPMPGPPSMPPPSQRPQAAPSYQPPPPQQPGHAPPPPPYTSAAQSGYAPPPSRGVEPPKKKRSGCLIAGIVVAGLFLCIGVLGIGAWLFDMIPLPTTPVPATIQPPIWATDTPAPSGTTASLDIVNNLDVAICYLHVSSSSADDWGDDWLWEMGTIEPGTMATFWLEADQTVDMQALDCEYNVLDEQYGVYVFPEGLTYSLGP